MSLNEYGEPEVESRKTWARTHSAARRSSGYPPCGAGRNCAKPGKEADLDEDAKYDRYGIYAGCWHDKCWDRYGYGDFVFDASYAGESLEAEDY